jgi:hypothetical protein
MSAPAYSLLCEPLVKANETFESPFGPPRDDGIGSEDLLHNASLFLETARTGSLFGALDAAPSDVLHLTDAGPVSALPSTASRLKRWLCSSRDQAHGEAAADALTIPHRAWKHALRPDEPQAILATMQQLQAEAGGVSLFLSPDGQCLATMRPAQWQQVQPTSRRAASSRVLPSLGLRIAADGFTTELAAPLLCLRAQPTSPRLAAFPSANTGPPSPAAAVPAPDAPPVELDATLRERRIVKWTPDSRFLVILSTECPRLSYLSADSDTEGELSPPHPSDVLAQSCSVQVSSLCCSKRLRTHSLPMAGDDG